MKIIMKIERKSIMAMKIINISKKRRNEKKISIWKSMKNGENEMKEISIWKYQWKMAKNNRSIGERKYRKIIIMKIEKKW